MTLRNVIGLSLRAFSVLFKLAGVSCIIIAVLVARNIAEQPGRESLGLNYLPDAYLLLIFVLAFLVPFLGGIILFGVSFLLDIWVVLRSLKPKRSDDAFLSLLS
jgi:hypothetical protein